MSKIELTKEDHDYGIALQNLTESINSKLSGDDLVLNASADIKHEIVFQKGQRPLHRLHWLVN